MLITSHYDLTHQIINDRKQSQTNHNHEFELIYGMNVLQNITTTAQIEHSESAFAVRI
jgi:hypothetical protein